MSDESWRALNFFMAGFALCLIIGAFICPGFASAGTIKSGDTLFITGTPSVVTVTCNVSDGEGVGMGKGLSMFGVKYENETEIAWLPQQAFEESAVLTLDVIKGKKFKIEGKFADSLENWMESPVETPLYLMVDSNAPTGGVKVKIDIDITIEVN